MLRLYVFLLLFLAHLSARADDSGSTGILSAIRNAVQGAWDYIKGIFKAISKFVEWLGKLVVEVFKAAWDMLTDSFVWIFEALFKLAAKALDGVADSFGLSNLAQQVKSYWDLIPIEVLQIMQAIGVSSAFAIVVLGILIRFAMQLIPFVRLGS